MDHPRPEAAMAAVAGIKPHLTEALTLSAVAAGAGPTTASGGTINIWALPRGSCPRPSAIPSSADG